MIFQLIYTCALASSTDVKDLREIATQAAQSNADRELTGVLLCQDGSVLQVLEGDQSTVESLFTKICQDSRITRPLVLLRRLAAKREFPSWSMGFRHADERSEAFNLHAESLRSMIPQDATPEVRTIGQTFARVNGLA